MTTHASRAWELPNPVRSAALARPDSVALVTADASLSWSQLDDLCASAAGRYHRLGVADGMVVALAGPADADWTIAFHGLLRLGVAVAPLSSRAPGRELRRSLQSLAPDRVVTTAGASSSATQAAAGIAATYPAATDDEMQGPVEPAPERWVDFDRPALRLLTSGTTGRPRPVDLTWGQWVMSACGTALRLGHLPEDRWLCCLPLHHIGGLMILLRAALGGNSVELHNGFDPAAVAEALDSGRIACTSLAPVMLEAVLDARPGDRPFPSSLRTVLLGGERTPSPLRRRCEALGLPIVDAWGMTETASHVTLAQVTLDQPGVPTPFARVDVREDGRLTIRGPMADGHRITDDRGALDDLGRVTVLGRADAVLTSAGESYHPAEIEDVLTEHPSIRGASVTGIQDDRWGQRPVALLEAVRGTTRPTDETLQRWCRDRLSRHKQPARFEWTTRLPRKLADA